MKVLVNKCRRRLGIPGHPAIILAPGESKPVSEQKIKEMQANKTISRWLNNDVLELLDESEQKARHTQPAKPPPRERQKPPMRTRPGVKNDVREPQVLPEGLSGEGIELHHKGGGWYEVYVNGFKVTDKNVRKDEAEEIATEYK